MLAKMARSKQITEVFEKGLNSPQKSHRNSVVITNASNNSSNNSRFISNYSNNPGSSMKKIAPKNSRSDTLESDEK